MASHVYGGGWHWDLDAFNLSLPMVMLPTQKLIVDVTKCGVLIHVKSKDFFTDFSHFFQFLYLSPKTKMSGTIIDLRRVVKNHPILSASSAAALAITTLAAMYPDRAVFHPLRKDITRPPGWPLVGDLPYLIQYKDKIYDFFVEGFEQGGAATMYIHCTV